MIMSFLISDVFAETTGSAASQSTASGLLSILPMIILLVGFMYFMVIRPQSKRAKEHKNLLDNLQKGDEVVTIGGILGKIEKISNDFMVISIADNTNITVQKSAISNIVPRGTMKTVE